MAVLNDAEKDALTINRMIFHVVGKDLEDPILLGEIAPPKFSDFFIQRVKSALVGNEFEFRDGSTTEAALREMVKDKNTFVEQTVVLARDFQSRHSGSTSMGVFFVFELGLLEGDTAYALIKYDNEDVVRYILPDGDGSKIPELQRFQETFVRKADAMQKIAVVRLIGGKGGQIIVKDRSKPTHISDYFQGFLQAKRVHSEQDLGTKLLEALKATMKNHRNELPSGVQKGGVDKIHSVLRQDGQSFDPEACEPLLSSIFGNVPDDAPLRRTFTSELKHRGISDESFIIDKNIIPQPRRRIMSTVEGTEIRYDIDNKPVINKLADDREEIVIKTAKVVQDDAFTEKN